MSMDYWICEGVGIRIAQLYPFLNRDKCLAEISKQWHDQRIIPERYGIDVDAYLDSLPPEDLSDLLCYVDDTDTLSSDNDGVGDYFFYYESSYPWQRRENEPTSLEEVHNNIYLAVRCLCDISREELENLIDDNIYEYGCG